MAGLARLSFWVTAERMADFAEEYDRRIAPVLGEHGLGIGAICERPAVEGIFSRVFDVDGPSAAQLFEDRLRKDSGWQELIQMLGDEFGEDEGTVRWQFAVYCMRAGKGVVVSAGPGYRQGLWLGFGVQDGLGAGSAEAILQDREGNMWFGASRGVSRYDGAEFATFTRADGLAGDQVHALVEDREGNLWFGTDRGASRYDGAEFITFTCADGLAGDQVHALVEDRRGNLWFGTDRGASRYDGAEFVIFTEADGLSGKRVCCILEDREGRLWFSSGEEGKGVSWYDGANFSALTVRDGLDARVVRDMIEDREGNLWFGTDQGAVRYNGESFFTLNQDHGLSYQVISALLEDRDGVLWVGAMAGGLNRYDGTRCTVFTTHDGLANNHVLSMCQDREDRLWFGLLVGGVARYDGARFEHFTRENMFFRSFVFDILEDRKGDLWFGLLNGASRYDGHTFEHFEPDSGKVTKGSRYVCAMLEDRNGHLWFRNLDGVVRYDGEAFTPFIDPENLAGQPWLRMLEDREGNLWLNTGHLRRGVLRYDGREFARFTTDDGLVDDAVFALLEDREGILWFGTQRGLSRYDGHTFTNFTADDGLASDQIGALLEDREGILWIGTERGLCRYDGRAFTAYPAGEKQVPTAIHSMIQDRRGDIWLGSFGEGVCRFDGRVFQRFDRRDGLVNDAVQRILEDRQGNIWIGTEGGATRYQSCSTPPRVRIREVVADQRYPGTGKIVLPASQKLVTFSFRGSSLDTPHDRMAYVYRLRGHDVDWKVAYAREASYEGLNEGEYTFEVKAVDRDLNYSQAAEVQVVVEPDPHLQALHEALSADGAAGEWVGNSRALVRVQDELAEVAPTGVTVLILGETGTGKGLAARTLHALSERRDGPFVQVSCGTIPGGLIESELFGHEKGAFTGAVGRKLGKVELARGGTLFLDEIGDLELGLQTKLLRLLEEGTFERVGGMETLESEVRVVAATNRDLPGMVAQGRFREDLYYRLNVFAVRLPPLRERVGDIPLLAYYFLERMAEHLHKKVEQVTEEGLALLQRYRWPGNVRELEHVMQRGVIVCRGRAIGAEDLALEVESGNRAERILSMEEVERRHIVEVLKRTGWVIKGERGAARLLGLPASTLRSRMKKLGIARATG